MRELWPIFIFSLLMAYLADKNSISKIDGNGNKEYVERDKLYFFIIFLVMGVFVGLRTDYNDTYAYRHAYELMGTTTSGFSDISYTVGDNVGFNIVNQLFRIMGISTQSFIMIYALVTNGIYLWFIRKYSNNYFISIFLYSTMGVYTFTMAAIKQCIAVAFCLIATDKAINKKYYSFIFWILIATTFHPYSLMYLIVPFLKFDTWTYKTYFLLAIFALAGVGLQSLLGTIVNITTMLGEGYDASSFIGEGVNIFRLFVVWVPVIISFFCRKYTINNDDKKFNVIMNLSMLTAEIMFIALFGTANYFARLANYFLIFQAIALPMLFKYFDKYSQRLLMVGALAGYTMYFAYAEGVLNGGFDALHSGISIFVYLRSVF